MYVLYLDDSGSPANANEEYFVLGGVCVPEMSIRWLTNQIEQVAAGLCPGCPESVELHAAAIFGGRDKPWNEMRDRPARIAVMKRVLGVLDNANPSVVVFACAVHKGSYPGQDPVQMAFEDLSNRFDLFLSLRTGENPARGLIVFDKSTYETSLQTLAANFRRQGNQWGGRLRNLCEVPLFVDSTASRIIQLADHIAYAVFRRYNANDLNYYECIEGRFDCDERGVMHGLVHKQTQKWNCTCPACLSRRLIAAQ